MPEEKENKDWIWTTLVLAFLIGGFFIFKKSIQMSRERHYYAFYSDIKGLQASSPVMLKGVRVGKISNIVLNGGQKVKVTITLKKDNHLPRGTVALLASGDVMGDKAIRLVPGTGPGFIQDEETIPTAFDTSVMPTSVQIAPYFETMRTMLGYSDSTLQALNEMTRRGLLTSVTRSFIFMETETRSYATLAKNANSKSSDIIRDIHSIHNTAKEISANNRQIKNTIRKADTLTDRMAKSPLKDDIKNIRASINNLNKSIGTLGSRDSGIGNYLDNKEAYENAVNKTADMNSSLKGLKSNPPGFSIFGGKKKK